MSFVFLTYSATHCGHFDTPAGPWRNAPVLGTSEDVMLTLHQMGHQIVNGCSLADTCVTELAGLFAGRTS